MLYLVTGGSGSGKSAFAEDLVTKLNKDKAGKLFYVATMHSCDKESEARIQRHQNMRRGKGFATIEKETLLNDKKLAIDKNGTYLIEDLSNLLANEMYIGSHREWFFRDDIPMYGTDELLNHIKDIWMHAENVVVVTNEIFSECEAYHIETKKFIEQLGYINCHLAETAVGVIEVVCGIPIWQKGKE